jgi:hypothetical protein
LIKAVSEHIAYSNEFPTIAGLRHLALAGQQPSPGNVWGEVARQMQKIRRYRTPAPSHPLCDSNNLVAERVHFLRIYEGLVKPKTAKKISFPILQKPCMARTSSPAQIGNAIQAGGYQEPALPGENTHVK